MVDAARPLVSLVVASRIGGDELMASIESFVRVGDDRFEIIVAEAGATGTAAAVAQRFPEVRVEHFDERPSIPELRAAGIRAARGDIIAMTTGRCRADGMWLTRLRQAHRGTAAAVGGAIEYAGDGRLIDRAVFFCEYGRYVPPFDEGPSVDLPGQNVSYTRAAIEQIADLVASGSWEPLWHWRLKSRGLELVRDPTRIVWMTRRFTFRGFFVERYHYSRAFAGQRMAGRSWFSRVMFAAATPLLPPLLIVRFVRQILAMPGRRLELLCLMPYLILFTIPWTAGECVGYAAGPGSSAARID